MMNKKRIALSALAASALVALALSVSLVACKSEDKSAPPPPAVAPPAEPPAAPAATPPAAAPAGTPPTAAGSPPAGAPAMGGGSSIEGAVLFTGTAPVMKALPTGADSKCPKGVMDESVVVKGGKLANVWVHVTKGASGAAAAPAGAVDIVQEGCMYRPRIQAAMVGQKITVKNHDDTLHNVHTYLGADTAFNKGMPGKAAAAIDYTPSEEGMIKWKCDVHPWMRGYIGVSKNGLQATSSDSGEFKIANVPPGTYTIEAWHEKYGSKTAEVTVEAGKPAKIEFKYDGTEKGT